MVQKRVTCTDAELMNFLQRALLGKPRRIADLLAGRGEKKRKRGKKKKTCCDGAHDEKDKIASQASASRSRLAQETG